MEQIVGISYVVNHSPNISVSVNSTFKLDIRLSSGDILRVTDQEFVNLYPTNWKLLLLSIAWYELPSFDFLWYRLKHLARRKLPDILK